MGAHAGAQGFRRGLRYRLRPVSAFRCFYFVDGNVQNGCICLGIAFLLSPYGLHYLAVKLTARFIGMRMLLKERIYG